MTFLLGTMNAESFDVGVGRVGCCCSFGVGAFLAGDVLPKTTMGMTAGVLRGGNTDLAKHCSKFASHDAVVVSMS